MSTKRDYAEITFGSRWLNYPSPQRYQIWRIECRAHNGCEFFIEPSRLRQYDEYRKDHPQPYGNLASISHARKLMREHIREKHTEGA